MTVGLLITISLIFLFLPVLTIPFTYRKYGMVLPGKVAVLWWIFILAYYIALFNFGPEWINKKYPIQVHKESVCEIKTTYSRKGLN